MPNRVGWLAAAVTVVAASACTSSSGHNGPAKPPRNWFQARPLIMSGQHATAARSDPFRSLRPPTTEDAFENLSRAQQADVVNALRAVDCAHPPQLAGGADLVACDSESDVFLLGAPLFTGDDVTAAKPSPPSGGVAEWQLTLTLASAAADRISRWTSQHHVASQTGEFNDVQTSSEPPCGPDTITQCSDFTAYLTHGVVVTVPVSFGAAGKTITVQGPFTEASATGLAGKLAG
jgi:hypothetical protein